MIVCTDRLVLRPFALTDTEDVYLYGKEASFGQWLPEQVYSDMDGARAALENLISNFETGSFPFYVAIESKADGALMGHVGFNEIPQGVEIDYSIGERFQNHGFGSEAVAAFVEWGKKRFNLQYVFGLVNVENSASCRVLEKAGFSFFKVDYEREFDDIQLRKVYLK